MTTTTDEQKKGRRKKYGKQKSGFLGTRTNPIPEDHPVTEPKDVVKFRGKPGFGGTRTSPVAEDAAIQKREVKQVKLKGGFQRAGEASTEFRRPGEASPTEFRRPGEASTEFRMAGEA